MASRQASALLLQLPPERRWRRLNRLLQGLAAGVLLAMPGLHLGWPDGALLALVAAALAVGALWPLGDEPAARLRWDGAQWWWQDQGPEQAVDLEIRIDLGDWMLLEHKPVEARWRFWRGGHRAVSRRGLGPSAWPAFRQRLLLARA